MCLYQLVCSATIKLSSLSAPSSSLFSKSLFHLLSYPWSSKTSHRRRGAHFTVRADAVSKIIIVIAILLLQSDSWG